MADCRTCDKIAYISIGWKYALDGTYPEPAAIARNLEHRQSLKFGNLYQCRNCDLYWFLDDDDLNMHRVTPDKTESLFTWAGCELRPTAAQIKRFQEIGATGPDQYGNGRGEITIPGAIETVNGQLHDPALILITKMPPIADWQHQTLLGTDVDTISKSDFALPLDVRLATLSADELLMGYAPTRVQAIDGRNFILNWSPNFFASGQLKGCDISLSSVAFQEGSETPLIDADPQQVTYVYYDWFPGCESLIESM